MIFFNFVCQNIESVGLSEIVLEPLPDSDNFDYFLLFYAKISTNVQSRHQEIQSLYMDCR